MRECCRMELLVFLSLLSQVTVAFVLPGTVRSFKTSLYDSADFASIADSLTEKVEGSSVESLPSIEIPDVDMSSINIPSIDGVPQEVLIAGAAVIVLIGIFSTQKKPSASSSKTATSEPDLPPIDVSIPYDAAARLAFQQTKEKEGGPSSPMFFATPEIDEEEFAAFKEKYNADTVSMVVQKKKARDAAAAASKK